MRRLVFDNYQCPVSSKVLAMDHNVVVGIMIKTVDHCVWQHSRVGSGPHGDVCKSRWEPHTITQHIVLRLKDDQINSSVWLKTGNVFRLLRFNYSSSWSREETYNNGIYNCWMLWLFIVQNKNREDNRFTLNLRGLMMMIVVENISWNISVWNFIFD